MKLSEFRVGDRVTKVKGSSDYYTVLFIGKTFSILETERGEELWTSNEISTETEWFQYIIFEQVSQGEMKSYDLMAPAILQNYPDDPRISTCLFSSEQDAKKEMGSFFHSWPALIDTETGMYRVPREGK